MAKKNSLKLVPYAPHKISTYEYDESLYPEYTTGPSYWESPEYKRYQDSRKEVIHFEGTTLLAYTDGRPGEQDTIGYGANAEKIEWKDNEPFEATLTIRELERGRSAARFWFEDEENKVRYPFFGHTLVDMLENSVLDHGKVKGTWIVVKKGANYGVELYHG